MIQDKEMIKGLKKKARLVLLAWMLGIAAVMSYGVYWVFYDWSRFKQELIAESTSPDGTYTIDAYRSNGGATTGYAILGELIFNKENRKSKKIYWQYQEENAKIVWEDDNTVLINGIQLEIPYESYDYRNGIKK